MAPTEQEQRVAFQKMKLTGGQVDLQDFIDTMDEQRIESLAPEKLNEAFDVFDAKRLQYFDEHDLRRVMLSLGEDLTTNQLRDMVRRDIRNYFYLSLADSRGRLPRGPPHQQRGVRRHDGHLTYIILIL